MALPRQAARLLALHTKVLEAARLLTGAGSDEAAIQRLRKIAKDEDRPPLAVPAVVLVSQRRRPGWRDTPLTELSRDYPVGSDRGSREISAG